MMAAFSIFTTFAVPALLLYLMIKLPWKGKALVGILVSAVVMTDTNGPMN